MRHRAGQSARAGPVRRIKGICTPTLAALAAALPPGTSTRAGRSPGPKGASASVDGGRHAIAAHTSYGGEAAARARLGTARRRACTPTLAAVAAAWSPKGALARLGTARRRACTPTLAAVAAAWSPEGARARLG